MPTRTRPSADATTRPTPTVMATAATIRSDRNASHRIMSTIAAVIMPLRNAPSRNVATSSPERPIGGQPYLRLKGGSECRVLGRGTDGGGCRRAGLERAIVEDRPSLDDATQLFRLGRRPVQQYLPGERRRS